ncbi:egt [Cyclophragma undans nucleopolyhedrovirus]|uniref:Ecdysteroid UDP-glucosyltransferase n=1 Tax=Cyclophragma undans nucleopolyhedrovirus TaxID=1906244 RepID=A0A288QYV1_9ABAC|nr:egt [Cyclophragma undans nucleopolyhedrovirus]AOT85594.1 egt [Cyclophragma undans nucleopolyhedrovirus]
MFPLCLLLSLLLSLSTTTTTTYAADVLAVFPTPAYSHHIVYKVYIEALADRCHNVTVVKPKLLNYKANIHCGTISEINADMSTEQYKKLVSESAVFRKRGVVSDEETVTAANYMGLIEMFRDQFDNRHVQDLITSNRTFDLVIVEAFAIYALVFGHLYRPAPVIQIAPGYGLAENFDAIGAVARHPVHYPNIWRSNFNADERANAMTEVRLYREFKTLTRATNALLKQQFGLDTPTVEELQNQVQLFLLNLHPIFDNNRPVPPSVQYLGGGLHLIDAPILKLDSDLDALIDSAKRGVIYVSFGSSIDTNAFAEEFRSMLIDTFAVFNDDYTILWKIDDAAVQNITLPSNVVTRNWFNQRAVLNHPKTVGFITQGGLQSSDEAIDAQVPMVCLPMMGDQFHHAHKLHRFGVAHSLDTAVVTHEQLLLATQSILSDAAYRNNIKKLRATIRHDKALYSPVEKAIKLTERVLRYRNGGESFLTLKPTAANEPYSNYYMYQTVVSILTNILL